MRAIALTALIWSHAVVLLVAGIATLWWSQDLMRVLIHSVGEERALGAANVIRPEGGGILLTNPRAMVRWMIPLLGSGPGANLGGGDAGRVPVRSDPGASWAAS